MSFCSSYIKLDNFPSNKENLIAIISNYKYDIEKFQTHLIRAFNSLDSGLNNPPKPHAFVSLPLQSNLFNIIKMNHLFVLSINHARFFSRHPVFNGDKDPQHFERDPTLKRFLDQSSVRGDNYIKQMEEFIDNFNKLTKDEAIAKWKNEMEANEHDYKRVEEKIKDLGVADDHPFARDDYAIVSTRVQSLEDAAYTCKHKLTNKDAGLDNPAWMKERDEYLQNVQDSEPLDIIDPDC